MKILLPAIWTLTKWLFHLILKILFAMTAIFAIYIAICFFLAENDGIFSGDVLNISIITLLAFCSSFILLVGVPIIMSGTWLGKRERKNCLKNKEYFKIFKWLVIISLSLLASIYGSYFGMFAVSEFFQISIGMTFVKLLTAVSIAINIMAAKAYQD